jgi:hypothetical protein
MLGYSTPQGDLYVHDSGKLLHLEHQQINSSQAGANSFAYIAGNGDLKYYTNHELNKLDIANPVFYKNTDHYLYYSLGGNFSLYNGTEKQFLGNIQHLPYAFGDSIAAVHDFSEYFYAYTANRFIELEQNPVLKAIAGDNLLAYINHIGQFKIFYRFNKFDADEYPPISMQASADIVCYVDNYQYLRVFYKGQSYELYMVPDIICPETAPTLQSPELPAFCDEPLLFDLYTELPLYKTGDGLVAYLDDQGAFQVFYDGVIVVLEDQPPLFYEVTDNVVYYADNNNYFKVFMNGELHVVESFVPPMISADDNIVVYTDLDKRLHAIYNGNKIRVSETIVNEFSVNRSLIMYSDLTQ